MKRDIVVFIVGLLLATLLAAITSFLTNRAFLDFVFLFFIFYGVVFIWYLQWRTPIVTGEELQRKLDREARQQASKLNRK